MSSKLDDYVLELNKHWVPLDTCTVAHAFSRLWTGSAKFLDTETFTLVGLEEWLEKPVYEDTPYVSTSHRKIRIPEVIILTTHSMPTARTMVWSRRNLMRRDRYLCQYCAKSLQSKDLTIDHVFPRRRGGKTEWKNTVMSCYGCNSKKRDRTPKEANMRLIDRPEMKILHPRDSSQWNIPYEPTWSPLHRVNPSRFKKSWKQFVTDKLETALEQTTK